MSRLQDKIWITARARMASEKRYQRYDITAHLLLSYMSFLMILVTVFGGDLEAKVRYFRQLEIIIPLALFGISLIIYGFKFGEKASHFRECYLRLQALENTFAKRADPERDYEDILKQCPNHSDWDYEDVLVRRTYIAGTGISVGGLPLPCTRWMIVKWTLRQVFFWVLSCGIPVVVTLWFVCPMLEHANS